MKNSKVLSSNSIINGAVSDIELDGTFKYHGIRAR